MGNFRIEKKFVYFTLDENVIAQGASFLDQAGPGPEILSHSINDIVAGTGESQRIGRKCTLTQINMRLNFEFVTTSASDMTAATLGHESIRLILFWDRQCNGAAAASGQLLEGQAGGEPTYNHYRNLANIKRFIILKDKIYTFNTTVIAAGNGSANDSEVVIKDWTIKINKKVFIPIEFDNTTGNLSGIRSNNVGLLVWGKHGNRIRINASRCRIRFIDY